jgi:transposase
MTGTELVRLAVGEPTEPTEPTAGVPTELPPEKQSWYRPADSKIRKKVEKILVMRAAGHHDRAIAKKLGSTEATIRQDVYLARKNGWLDEDGEPIDLEMELALNIERKVVRNISASLDGQMTNWQTHEMTIAAAKGRGIFKTHEKSEALVEGMQVVTLQVVRPPEEVGLAVREIPADQCGGRPAYLEGEVDLAEHSEGGGPHDS